MELELTNCPECGHPAEVVHRSTLQSTDGPVEHVKIRCISGHGFLMPVDDLARPPRRSLDVVPQQRLR